MKKIPTLFRRDPDDMRRVLREVTPGCEWVLAGEGIATRKYDGTCCMFDGDRWWARREVKPGKMPPTGFLAVETDGATGKTVGWEPMAQSPFAKFHAEAAERAGELPRGTYELCGPKIQGNPESFAAHTLIAHAFAEEVRGVPHDFDGIRDVAVTCGYEGIVWHHEDGRKAKIKARDFQRESPRV